MKYKLTQLGKNGTKVAAETSELDLLLSPVGAIIKKVNLLCNLFSLSRAVLRLPPKAVAMANHLHKEGTERLDGQSVLMVFAGKG